MLSVSDHLKKKTAPLSAGASLTPKPEDPPFHTGAGVGAPSLGACDTQLEFLNSVQLVFSECTLTSEFLLIISNTSSPFPGNERWPPFKINLSCKM